MVALISVGLLAAKAQTAEDVIGKYITAMGGMEKLKSIQSLYTESKATVGNGFEITTRTYRVQDKLYRQELDFGRGAITVIVTDQEGWFSNPRNEGAFEALPAKAVADQQFELDCAGPLVDFAAKGHRADLVGKEKIGKQECYHIKLQLKSGAVMNYYIDNQNWYIIRTTTPATNAAFGFGGRQQQNAPTEQRTDYADYKKNEAGFLFPMTISRPGMGGRDMTSNIVKVEVNKAVDPALYKPE